MANHKEHAKCRFCRHANKSLRQVIVLALLSALVGIVAGFFLGDQYMGGLWLGCLFFSIAVSSFESEADFAEEALHRFWHRFLPAPIPEARVHSERH